MFHLFKSRPKPIAPSPIPVTLLPGSEGEHYLQHKYGTTQRALRFYDKQVLNYLSPVMLEFIARQEVLFIATADKHGDCDCSFRFGKPGFVRPLNEKYLVYPEYRGNGVMASQGNIIENPHIGMIFVDFFESTVGLHVNGKAKIVEQEDLLKYRKELSAGIIKEMNAEGKHRPERWIMVEIEEAYIHCSKHIPLLKKTEKNIAWGTDDDSLKRSDFFALHDIPLYQRIGGEPAIQVITDSVVRKLLLDEMTGRFLQETDIQSLLDKQKHFLKSVFSGEAGRRNSSDGNLRETYRKMIDEQLNDLQLDTVVEQLKKTLLELDVPEHEVLALMESLAKKHAD
jgi:predicted pyridoxine 5'-phosphate oxidase superfamily flavin-nucleotide-binding protein/truncated hemoglobin YjbI